MIVSAAPLYDDGGRRLVVLLDHPYVDPVWGDMTVTGIWALADSGAWTAINENLGRCCTNTYSFGIDDRARRRSLRVAGGALAGVDLRPGHEAEDVSVDAGGPLAVEAASAAFDTTRGRILAGGWSGLAAMAVRDGSFAWRDIDGLAPWPGSSYAGYSIVYDAGGDRAVLFGGADQWSTALGADVHVMDLGAATPSWSLAVTTGTAPGARAAHEAVVDPATRTMYVVGGYRNEGGVLVDYADVFALDLSSMAWRAVATLPGARSWPLLRLANGGADLYVLFGERHSGADPYSTTDLRDGYRIATATGAVEELSVGGGLPSVVTHALAGLDLPSAFVVVSPEPYGIETYRGEFSGTSVTFARSAACEDSRGYGQGPGVVDPSTGVGYVVGRAVWEFRE
jgi:hypothetical protein